LTQIRIFEYPCQTTGYYRIYSNHLSFIRTLKVSKNGEYLISTSSIDKCLFIWKIQSDRSKQNDNPALEDDSFDEY
jgi:WD40 repeat protein